jgi:PKD domain
MRLPHRVSCLVFAAAGTAVAASASAVGLQMGHRPEIGAIQAPATAKAGETVKITVTAKKEGSSGCGLLVKFGDGSDRQMKINRDEAKFPVTLEHAYKKDGRYTITASGREITTNKECKGGASAAIQVGEPKKAKKPAAKPKT